MLDNTHGVLSAARHGRQIPGVGLRAEFNPGPSGMWTLAGNLEPLRRVAAEENLDEACVYR